ncbi:ABC transporter permease subunit [Thermococcus sp.]|nr:ABC transporter permease subunit [Thermococcus sp.]MCD6144135.1 ABC transporter permease subunit [Thermococcus sp.]
MKELIRREINDPVILILVLIGSLLAGIEFKENLLTFAMQMSTTHPLLPPYGISSSILKLFTERTYSVLAFLMPLLATLSIRQDRDSGVAFVVYSLPYRKWEILFSKFIAIYSISVLFFTTTHIVIFLLHFSATPIIAVEAIKLKLSLLFVFYFLLLVFMCSLSSLIAILVPNSSVSLLLGFFFLYLPTILGISIIPWHEFISEEISFMEFAVPTVAFTLVCLSLFLIIGSRRDVV